MKIIFLDIDGVLNVMLHDRDKYGSLFHPQFVYNLKRIIDKTEAKIVISSSWRMSGLETMQNMWKDRDLPGEVIDITPDGWNLYKRGLVHRDYDRGHEIEHWLNTNDVEAYVIIDDDMDMLEYQMPKLVLTRNNLDHEDCVDMGLGLTSKCADKAIKILNVA